MVLQPRRARVCSGSRSLDASPPCGDRPVAKRFAISPERAWTLAFDENSGVARSQLRIVKDQPWQVISRSC